MNKNKLIALTLAAIYTQKVRDLDSPSGLINTHDGAVVHFTSTTLDYLRDKEGKDATRYDSKAVVKIAKHLWKRHKIILDVNLLPSKSKGFAFGLARSVESVKGAPLAGSVLMRHVAIVGVENEYQDTVQTFRAIVNLQAKAKKSKLGKTDKEERARLLGHLERLATVPHVSGEVAEPLADAA